jgi:ATP adenylyltransferase
MAARPPLWAPWRAEYLKRLDTGECIFCEPAQPVPDRERLVVFRGPRVFVLLNRYPYAPGHLMVAPYEHAARLSDLALEVQQELVRCVARCERIVEETLHPHGLNIGANLGVAAGAGFEGHLHVHVVPRWRGDTNFMTVVGDVRVISEELFRVYDELASRFAEGEA